MSLSASVFPREITPISNARQNRSSEGTPTSLQGVITGFSGWHKSFFLQDATGGISVDRLEDEEVQPGDEVEVSGEVHLGLFAPIIVSRQVRVIAHPGLPTAYRANYKDFSGGALDSKLVAVNGIIHSAQTGEIWGHPVLFLDLHTSEGVITVHILDFREQNFADLIDGSVSVEGVSGTIFNNRQQMVGLRLFVSNLKQIKILKAGVKVSELPVLRVSSLLKFGTSFLNRRVKVSGAVTYQASANEFYLQEEGMPMRIRSVAPGTWQPGMRVDASGYVADGGYLLSLQSAVVEKTGMGQVPKPVRISATDVIKDENGFTQTPYNGQLVELEGTIIEQLPTMKSKLWAMRSGQVLFEAHMPEAHGSTFAWEPGSRVSLTGICLVEEDEDRKPSAFRILLRSPEDIHALNAPYWGSSLLILLIVLALVLLGSLAVWLFTRRTEPAENEHSSSHSRPLRERFGRISRMLAALSVCLCGFVLFTWAFRMPFLQGPVSARMMPNAAIAALLASVAVWLMNGQKKPFLILTRAGLGWASAAIGAVTLLEYAIPWSVSIDTILIQDLESLQMGRYPGRMAIATALCLFITGSAIVFINRRRLAGFGQVLALAAGTLSLLNLIGNLFGSQAHYGPGAHATMSLPSAAALLLLSGYFVFPAGSRPDEDGLFRG